MSLAHGAPRSPMPNRYHPGQRWISDGEPELGIGEVRAVGPRTVSVVFATADESRDYSLEGAPLRRVTFRVGDTLQDAQEVSWTVDAVAERDGLFHFQCGDRTFSETELSLALSLSGPRERLFRGRFDAKAPFELRFAALKHQYRRRKSEVRGLLGGRIDLLPHQLSLASEVTGRLAPRVLLADEVGLGKTIEAGLILHRLLLTGRARRVLILVPESLVHQWFVELLRRFNLWFAIYDEGRCRALEESVPGANPFLDDQLVLCELGLFTRNPERFRQAQAAGWDLLVVDEAHHLGWSPEAASPEYATVEALGRSTPGLLLLTATPEQLGLAGHFARLRLLDPDRYGDLGTFLREAEDYQAVARLAEKLHEAVGLSEAEINRLAGVLQEDESKVRAALESGARKDLMEALLDQHGTGRVMFRNTRATVTGFPKRVARLHPLAQDAKDPDGLKALAREWIADADGERGGRFLPVFDQDPRVAWLAALLRSLAPAKVLLICHTQRKAEAIEAALRPHLKVKLALFHEGLTLVQRDRAAAWFADPHGARLLICSEIGSEGRNFQFAHHLVLFDLPLDPGLLEQRIGRLDRIGQTDTIQTHVPYLENSALAVMFHWYHEGLNAFEKTCPAGQTVFVKVEEQLIAALHQRQTQAEALAGLIGVTQTAHRELNEALDRGRDKLLEYNSFRPLAAEQLTHAARAQDNDPLLPQYMETVFDCCGVHIEDHRSGSFLIEPSEHMSMPFPGLQDEGSVITYAREVALANEDMHFLTWEHPMVTHAMERILSHENGNAVVAMMKHKQVQPGTLLLETLFVLEASGHNVQQSNRYLPPAVIRIVLDEHGSSDYPFLNHDSVNQHLQPVATGIAKQVIQLKEDAIRELLTASEQQASAQAPQLIAAAEARIRQIFVPEIERLKALQQVNPNVRDEEIQFFEQQLQQLTGALKSSNLRLDAVRVIVAT